ncbi:hypothetical protein CF15_02790 [Pyrodictium occultum]|uniref:HTH cro/C1-type domain-containing protein n=1 Tax=Pyrodictium occultum TaxID=2309 RepID=A0A0V8RUW4_PYROC|nr:hypothetical protein [Pyrodictium occultum]KSW11754.1 hypothetical protein CF15_02790 [Pyrodictium occultum]
MIVEAHALCSALSQLDPATRRRLVEIALESGYAAKDLAEIMGVSPAAVSRYTHGSLSPGAQAVCRLITGVDPDTRVKLLAEAARRVWSMLESLLDALPDTMEKLALAEQIADKVSVMLAEATVGAGGGAPERPRQGHKRI